MNGENSLEHCRGKNLGFSVFVSRSETSTIWVASGRHNCVFYSKEGKAKLCIEIMLKKVKLQTEFAFIEQRSVLRAGAGWKRSHGFQYNLYLIPEDVCVNDSMPFLYGISLQRNVRNKRLGIPGDVGLMYLYDQKENTDDTMNRNKYTVEMTKEAEGNSAIDFWRVQSIETLNRKD